MKIKTKTFGRLERVIYWDPEGLGEQFIITQWAISRQEEWSLGKNMMRLVLST